MSARYLTGMVLATCLFTPLTAQRDPAPQGPLANLSFFLGSWDIETRMAAPGGQWLRGEGGTHAYLTTLGDAMLDEYTAYGPNRTVVFRGLSIRRADPTTGGFCITWLGFSDGSATTIAARLENGELLGRGEGRDGNGAFVEEFRYFDITTDRFQFEMSRSYDGGTTWIRPFVTFTARRRSP